MAILRAFSTVEPQPKSSSNWKRVSLIGELTEETH